MSLTIIHHFFHHDFPKTKQNKTCVVPDGTCRSLRSLLTLRGPRDAPEQHQIVQSGAGQDAQFQLQIQRDHLRRWMARSQARVKKGTYLDMTRLHLLENVS